MKRFLLFAMAMAFAIQLSAQEETTYAVGEYGTGTSYSVPANNYFCYSYTQSIYPLDSLQPGLIMAISYKYAHTAPVTINPTTIYMAEVARSSFGSTNDYEPLNNLTEVFSGTVTFSQGWVRIDLDEPFNYTGEGNLLVAYLNGKGSYEDQSYVFNTFPITSASIDFYADEPPISPSQPSGSRNVNNFVPNTKFHMLPEGSQFCFRPLNVTVSDISSTSAEITWSANANTLASEYGVSYKEEGTEQWIELSAVSGTSVNLTDLAPYTRYEVKVWSVCPDGNSEEVIRSFCTYPDESMIQTIPHYEDFDNFEEELVWDIHNGMGMNQWYCGTVVNNTMTEDGVLTESGRAMYISNDDGMTNSFLNTSSSISYFSTFIEFGENDNGFNLNFDRKQKGDNYNFDYLRIYLVDVDEELSSTRLPDDEYAITDKLVSTNNIWVKEYVLIPGSYSNTTKKIVFAWSNDAYDGDNPPAAIDNIAITNLYCDFVTDVTVEPQDEGDFVSVEVNVTDANENTTEYIVEYKLETENSWTYYSSIDNPISVPDLLHGSRYDLRVLAVCDGTDTSFVSDIISFNTPCAPIINLPYTMSFEDTFQGADGIIGNEIMPLCWYNINGGYPYVHWSSSANSYPAYYYDGVQSLYFSGYEYDGNFVFSDWVISPIFELTGNERINFKAKAITSNNSPVVKVYARDVSEGDITSMADTATFTLIDEIPLIVSSDFEDYEIGLTAYTGNTRFALVVDKASSSFFIDSLTVSALSDCPNVYLLDAYPASTTSVAVDFGTSNGNGSGWILAYGQAATMEDFDPDMASSTIDISSSEDVPYILEGLNTGETYYFAVKQNCDGGMFSAPVSVTLPNNTTPLPYEQDFENVENISEWTFVSSANNGWAVGSAVNNTTGGSNSLYVSNDYGETNAYTSPSMYEGEYVYATMNVEFGEGTGFALSYDWKAGGSYENYMNVYLIPIDLELFNTSAPVSSYKINSDTQYGEMSWTRDTIVLDGSYANKVMKLVFMWKSYGSWDGTTYNPPAAVDNISLTTRGCVEVTNLTLTSEDMGESANMTVSFTNPNDVGTYTIEYKQADDSEWITISDLTENTYVIEDLLYGTEYDVRVMTICSEESYSNYVESSAYTFCSSLETPWSETFVSDVTISPCWSKAKGLLPNGTIQSSSLTSVTGYWNHSTSIVGGISDGRMRLNLYGIDNNYWLITPSIDLGDGSTTYQITVDVMLTSFSGVDNDPIPAPDDRFAILVSTDNGSTWSSANALIYADNDEDTEHNFSVFGRTPTRAVFKLVDANDDPITGIVKFAFYGESTQNNGGDNYLYIDNIEVSEWSECQSPYGLTVSNLTYNSASLAFVEPGNATEWEYVLVEEGEDIEMADAVTAFTNPIELTDLEGNTTYTVKVRSVCSEDVTSSFSQSFSFTTKCAPMTEFPWTESFESITADNELPACMEATRLGTYVKTYTSAQSNYNQAARTGTKFASFRYGSNDYIFTPTFELAGGTEYTFAFWYVTDGRSGWTTLEAKLCSGQTESDILSTIGTSVTSPANETYQQYVATFIPEEDGVYSIAIHCAATTSPWYLSIDDLSLTEGGEVVEPEPCVEPTDLTVANVTETTAELSRRQREFMAGKIGRGRRGC